MDEQSPDFAFYTEIMMLSNLLSTRLERALSDGLSVAQFGVLNRFTRLGGQETPAQLAAAFQVTKGAMTNTLQRLQAHGLVEVVDDPADGRRKRVSITPAGRLARDRAVGELAPLMIEIRKDVAIDPLMDALPTLARLRVWLNDHRDG